VIVSSAWTALHLGAGLALRFFSARLSGQTLKQGRFSNIAPARPGKEVSMKRIVRYKVKPGHVEENERLSKRVYEALQRNQPKGLHYATFKMEDGLSFVHIVSYDNGRDNSILVDLPEFKEFVADIKERCEEMPVNVELAEVGSYHFFGA
jgi:hypothetical protein